MQPDVKRELQSPEELVYSSTRTTKELSVILLSFTCRKHLRVKFVPVIFYIIVAINSNQSLISLLSLEANEKKAACHVTKKHQNATPFRGGTRTHTGDSFQNR